MTDPDNMDDARYVRQRDALISLAATRVLTGENLSGTLQRLTETCAQTLARIFHS